MGNAFLRQLRKYTYLVHVDGPAERASNAAVVDAAWDAARRTTSKRILPPGQWNSRWQYDATDGFRTRQRYRRYQRRSDASLRA